MQNFLLKEKSVKTKTGEIFYYANEKFSKKPTIVFLHGLASNHATWSDIALKFDRCGYNCLVLDMRGHGNSDKTKKKNLYKIAVFSNDLKLILEKENINKIILIGYSFGGAVALEFAYKNYEKLSDLILISANHVNPLFYTKWKFLIPIINFFLNLAAFLVLWQKKKVYHYYYPHQATGYWNSVWLGFETMPWSVNIWMLLEMAKLDFYKRGVLSGLSGLIIYSQRDPFLSTGELQHLSKILPKAELIASKNNSHFIATQSQNEAFEIIFNYLKKYENSYF